MASLVITSSKIEIADDILLGHGRSALEDTDSIKGANIDFSNLSPRSSGTQHITAEINATLRIKHNQWKPYLTKQSSFITAAIAACLLAARIFIVVWKKVDISEKNYHMGNLCVIGSIGLANILRSIVDTQSLTIKRETRTEIAQNYKEEITTMARWYTSIADYKSEIAIAKSRCQALKNNPPGWAIQIESCSQLMTP